jgi:hypothetical protein
MAVEISAAGYLDIRNYIESASGWKWVEIRDSLGAVWERLSTDDDRVVWTHTAGDNPIELSVTLTGSDVDITLPEEFKTVALFKAEIGGDALAVGDITQVTLEQATDQVIIRAQIQVPQIVV